MRMGVTAGQVPEDLSSSLVVASTWMDACSVLGGKKAGHLSQEVSSGGGLAKSCSDWL